MIRPSSFPMLAQCPQFDGQGGEFADIGTDRHAALKALLANGDDSEMLLLDDESQAGIQWAADYIKLHAHSDHPLDLEVRDFFTAPNFEDIYGTPDAVSKNIVFDFKWRERDYTAQMAAYSAMVLKGGFETVEVHILFGHPRHAQKLVFDQAAVDGILNPIFDRLGGEPRNCDYCHWCAKQLVCPANTKPALAVSEGYAEPGALDFTKWRPSEMMDNAEQLAFALKLWRDVLKKWGASVEFHAMEAATKHGKQLPGFTLKEKAGNQYVTDAQRAFELSGLEPEKFMKSCAVRLNTSAKYPDKLGLDSLYAEKMGIKKTPAKRDILKRLAEVIGRGKSKLSLVAAKGEGDETEEGEE